MKLALVRGRFGALAASRWFKPALRVLLAAAALLALAVMGRCMATPPVQAATIGVAPALSAAVAAAPTADDAGAAAPSSSTSSDAREAPAAAHRGPASPEDPVVLNHATEGDLQRLPGIGAKRASAIVALRAKLGRFRQLEDLLRVRGIGRRTLMRLRPLVRLDPAPQPDAGAS